MENGHQYSLDELPPLLYMADDDGIGEYTSDAQNYLHQGTECSNNESMGATGHLKNTNKCTLNRQHYNEFKDKSNFHMSVSSRTMYNHSTSSAESFTTNNITPCLQEPQPCTSHSSPPKLRKKKPQECTRCANHDISVPMKGHKHYCPFASCSCELCEVTQKKNYYSKMHQKLNRNRLGHEKLPQPDANNLTPATMYREFPESRRRELLHDLNETELDILDEVRGLCSK